MVHASCERNSGRQSLGRFQLPKRPDVHLTRIRRLGVRIPPGTPLTTSTYVNSGETQKKCVWHPLATFRPKGQSHEGRPFSTKNASHAPSTQYRSGPSGALIQCSIVPGFRAQMQPYYNDTLCSPLITCSVPTGFLAQGDVHLVSISNTKIEPRRLKLTILTPGLS